MATNQTKIDQSHITELDGITATFNSLTNDITNRASSIRTNTSGMSTLKRRADAALLVTENGLARIPTTGTPTPSPAPAPSSSQLATMTLLKAAMAAAPTAYSGIPTTTVGTIVQGNASDGLNPIRVPGGNGQFTRHWIENAIGGNNGQTADLRQVAKIETLSSLGALFNGAATFVSPSGDSRTAVWGSGGAWNTASGSIADVAIGFTLTNGRGFGLASRYNNALAHIYVSENGGPLTLCAQKMTWAYNGAYAYMDFGTVATRNILIVGQGGIETGEMAIAKTASMAPYDWTTNKFVYGFMGDSWGQTRENVHVFSLPQATAKVLGASHMVGSTIGGTGFIADTRGTNPPGTNATRIAAWASGTPLFLDCSLIVNDDITNPTALRAAVDTVLKGGRAASPNALILVTLWCSAGSRATNTSGSEYVKMTIIRERARLLTGKWIILNAFDGTWETSDGTVRPTSLGPMITGEGSVAEPTGTGNADQWIDEPGGRHPTSVGVIGIANYKAKMVKEAILTMSSAATSPAPSPAPAPAPAPSTSPSVSAYLFDVIVAEGDSITSGTANSPNSWPSQLATLTGLQVTNLGQSSTTLNQMKDNYFANDHAGTRYVAGKRNLLIIGSAGTNDFTQDNVTLAKLKEYIQNFAGKGKSTGYSVYIGTITPRTITGAYTSAHEAIRVEYNTWLKANYTSFADGVFDFASALSVTDLVDGLHPSNDGAAKMANVVKAAITNTIGTTSPVSTFLAIENTSFTLSQTLAVKYGYQAENAFYQRTLPAGTYTCGGDLFGDPRAGVLKSCYIVGTDASSPPQSPSNTSAPAPSPAPAPAPMPAVSTFIVDQPGAFSLTTATAVKYGQQSSNKFYQRTLPAGTYTCDDNLFGDPAPGILKSCYIVGSDTAAPPQSPVTGFPTTAPAPAPSTSPTPVSTIDAITTNGVIDDAKWTAMASKMHTDEGISYRYGNPSTIASTTLTTYYTPQLKFMPGGDVRSYQLGTYTNDSGDFASNAMHAAFIPDDPNARIGVSGIQSTSSSHTTFSMRPELSWTLYGQGLDAVETVYWKKQGKTVRNPICMAHALGRPGWAVTSLICFEDGFIATAGANTMTNRAFCQLPSHKKPTAIAITSSCEFAVVTVWDINAKRGELAVISLCGLGNDATIANPQLSSPNNEGWWGEWNEPHPGMHNLGNIVFMKIIGYLPLGIKAPTEVSVTTGHHRYGYLNGSGANETTGNTGNWNASEAQRQRWATGDYSNRYARQGMAMVISKTEKKVVFVDLKKIFTYMNNMYFGQRSDFLRTTNIGQNAGQWPFTFDEAPAQIPEVVKILDTESEPTAVMIYPYAFQDAHRQGWVGTKNGYLLTYDLGGYPQNGTPNGIVQSSSLFVAKNITSINNTKEKAFQSQKELLPDITRTLVICSREERAGYWVDMGINSNYSVGTIRRKFQDSRIIDPIKMEDTDNHGTEHYVVSISDYTGRQVHNMRWGPVILWTYQKQRYDMGVNGTDKFEYGGSMSLPGKVFCVTTANIS